MNNCKFCNNTRREPGIPGPCAWCEVRSTPVIGTDLGKPGSDMTVTAEFSQKDGRLNLISLTRSEPPHG